MRLLFDDGNVRRRSSIRAEPPLNPLRIVMTGVLAKQGAIFGAWVPRFFFLRADGKLLSSSVDSIEHGKVVGWPPCQVRALGRRWNDASFEVISSPPDAPHKVRALQLMAESKIEREKWVDGIGAVDKDMRRRLKVSE